MSKRPLTSDELGEKGENHFVGICIDAGLVANKAKRDRRGWDYVVQFQFETAVSATLDQRPAPISCHVQVKALWDDNRRIEAPLSSIEHLAKDPKPAFIYIVKFDEALEPTEVFLLHLLDDNLATILKRLRREHKRGSSVKDRTISFDAHKCGERIAPTGAALRHALLQQIGSSTGLPAYIVKKAKQLDELGYPDNRHKLTMTIYADSYDEFVEGFLGLRPLRASKVQHFETRFGIPILTRDTHDQRAELSIQPSEPRLGRAVFRGKATKPAIFDGDVRVPGIPSLPEKHFRVCFKCALFTMTIPLGEGRFNVKFEADTPEARCLSIDEWLNFHRLMQLFAEPGVSVQLTLPGLPPITFSTNEGCVTPEMCKAHYLAERLCERLRALAELAGIGPIKLTHEEVLDCRRDVEECMLCVEHALDRLPHLEFESDAAPDLPSTAFPLALFNIFPMGSALVAYAANFTTTARVLEGRTRWQGSLSALDRVSALENATEAYNAFVDAVCSHTGIRNRMVKRSDRLAARLED